MERLSVRAHRLSGAEDLPLPSYATPGSAGLDLYAAVEESVNLEPGDWALIPTGISLEVPQGYEGQVRGRSGLAARCGVGLVNSPGTIDSDYRGEIQVILINWGRNPHTLHRGDRIAQVVIAPVAVVELIETERLNLSERGGHGFGHTGG